MEMMKEKLVCAHACWASDPPELFRETKSASILNY